jgi:hypothetical protein
LRTEEGSEGQQKDDDESKREELEIEQEATDSSS